MLAISDVHAGYDGSVVLQGLSIEVQPEESVVLLGGNGVGKTTLMRVISGLMRPYSGTVEFLGEDITDAKAHERVTLGLVLVPEARRIFSGMTVQENLEMGAYLRRSRPSEVQADLDVVMESFPRLRDRRNQLGGTLSGGEEQMLAIARGLMSRPKLMMVDEPTLGLAPLMVEEVFRVLKAGWDWSPTLLIAEQNAHLALENADRGYVLQRGQIQLAGSADELSGHQELFASYLGEDTPERAPDGGGAGTQIPDQR